MMITAYQEAKMSPFLQKYLERCGKWDELYDYGLTDADYTARNADVSEQQYNRQGMIEALKLYHEPLTHSKKVYAHIESLANPETVVVVGGQQAGLLTGPLLTVYKIMTIILDAEERSKQLGVPVIPVFWIAGEDHDFDEVNHVYTDGKKGMEKHAYKVKGFQKPGMSQMELDIKEGADWLEEVFAGFGETAFTSQLLEDVKCTLGQSTTVSDFFARLTMELFEDYGLVLYDSGSPIFSHLRVPFFQQLIENVEELQAQFQAGTEKLEAEGFAPAVITSETSAHLFYTHQGNRLMLEYENGHFFIKNKGVSFTKAELLVELQNNPERFSNNVVSRPLMQEFLFPCLSFVSGPGELVYWGQIHPIFQAFDMKMPIVRPRMGLTVVERNIDAYLDAFSLSSTDVFSEKYTQTKQAFLQTAMKHHVPDEMQAYYQKLDALHAELVDYVVGIEPSYQDMMKRNLKKLREQFQFVEKKLQTTLEFRVETERNQFMQIENHLYPNHIYQERVWNVFYFMNLYGRDFVKRLMDLPYTSDVYHYIVKI